jgi:hypothetical protein
MPKGGLEPLLQDGLNPDDKALRAQYAQHGLSHVRYPLRARNRYMASLHLAP